MKEGIYSNEGYFEAKLQIRPADKKIIDYALSEITKRKNVFIAKEVKLKTGIDFYITSYRFAVSLARNMKRKFGGEIKISRQLYTQHYLTSKLVYRITVLYRVKKQPL
ncbi:hypothetical protein J4427_00140 [Candidatus Woesearchaeota archaeon]|nr:hypothetical protein [Candidatus Woesearchaeota archaeon]